jgi:hypothetical protein
VENGTLRDLVPALPRADAGRNDAAKDAKDPFGLSPEQISRNQRGAAMARAALLGAVAGTNEAMDVK